MARPSTQPTMVLVGSSAADMIDAFSVPVRNRASSLRRLISAAVTNINDPVFDEPRGHPGFRCLRARLSRQAGSGRRPPG